MLLTLDLTTVRKLKLKPELELSIGAELAQHQGGLGRFFAKTPTHSQTKEYTAIDSLYVFYNHN